MLNRNSKRTFILVASCAASALVMTGCRSMPGAGMLGMRGEPSAEALAGNGPTVTYPAPPSASATPEAIASVAGGTGSSQRSADPSPTFSGSPTTAQVAGFDISPGYATQATNMAAAEANGIATQTESKLSSTTTAPPSSATSSYAFGAKAFTPKSEPASQSGTSYALSSNSSIASVDTPVSAPSTSGGAFTPPPIGTTAAGTVAPSSTTKGFTLPTDSPSFSAITPPPSSGTSVAMNPTGPTTATFAPPTAGTTEPTDDIPVAASPDFSTASAATGYTAPSATTSVLPPVLPSEQGSGDGYMPGSTGTTSAYPTSGGTAPTTNGSYYR